MSTNTRKSEEGFSRTALGGTDLKDPSTHDSGKNDLKNLSTHDLHKSFGGHKVINGANIEVLPNKINLLIGANGSGKTTLVNLVSGLLRSQSGKVMYVGSDITNMASHKVFEKGIIRTFQTPKLFMSLTLFDNLLMARPHVGESFLRWVLPNRWENEEKVLTEKALGILDALGILGLKDHLAYDLSGGQIKLLELGKTLMGDFTLVLLDEPIAGIAPKLAHTIFEKIQEICKAQNTTFLIIEHRLDIALRYVDHVFVMHEGQIIVDGKPDTILQNKQVIESYLG